jgi:tetratricopeptide (TPR) repeat protein
MLSLRQIHLVLITFALCGLGLQEPAVGQSNPDDEGFGLDTLIDLITNFLSDQDPSALFREGLDRLQKNDLDGAEKAFKQSVKRDPKQIGSLLGLAEVAIRKGQASEGATYLQKAMSQAPNNILVSQAWGRYLYSQKNFVEAETIFKKAIDQDPQSTQARLNLGQLDQIGMKDLNKAMDVYREALAINPESPEVHHALGVTLAALNKTEEALAEFDEAGRLAPTNPLPYLAIGRVYTAQKEYDKALEAFAAALDRQPSFIQARLDRAKIFMGQGKVNYALAEYWAVVRVQPKLVTVLVQIGMIHQQRQELNEAERVYLDAIQRDPNQVLAYNNLAYMAAERKEKLNEALGWAQKAVELAPKAPEFHDTLGWVHRARGELDQALAALEKAASLEQFAQTKSNQAEILYHLGIIYAEKGRVQESGVALRKALDLRADFTGANDARQRLAAAGQASFKN